MRNVGKIYFCPDTLEFLVNLTERDKNNFALFFLLKVFTLDLTGCAFLLF